MKTLFITLILPVIILCTSLSGLKTSNCIYPKKYNDSLPGRGLAEHPFLYAGEWQNSSFANQKMYIVRNGQIEWEYVMPQEGEYGDATLLSNGHVLFARFHGASEVDQNKKTVWNFEAPANSEIHTCQAIGLDKVFLVINAVPARAILLDKKTNKILKELVIPTGGTKTHGMFRHCRYTKNGTFLIAHMDMDKVVEYNEKGDVLWSVPAKSAWGAVRLDNGHTLISGNSNGYTREVNQKGETVWEFTKSDAAAQGITLYVTQQAMRLANGNTIIANWCGGDLPKAVEQKSVQLIEVTPAKKVVWALSQWNNPNLNRASTIQLLDEKGKAENRTLQR